MKQVTLDEAGNLTESAIDRSFVVMSDGSAFNNQSVIDALINDGSNIADWQKRSQNLLSFQQANEFKYTTIGIKLLVK